MVQQNTGLPPLPNLHPTQPMQAPSFQPQATSLPPHQNPQPSTITKSSQLEKENLLSIIVSIVLVLIILGLSGYIISLLL